MQRSYEEPVFVVETCQNCKNCCWHTRHDEAKYIEYFNKGKDWSPLFAAASPLTRFKFSLCRDC